MQASITNVIDANSLYPWPWRRTCPSGLARSGASQTMAWLPLPHHTAMDGITAFPPSNGRSQHVVGLLHSDNGPKMRLGLRHLPVDSYHSDTTTTTMPGFHLPAPGTNMQVLLQAICEDHVFSLAQVDIHTRQGAEGEVPGPTAHLQIHCIPQRTAPAWLVASFATTCSPWQQGTVQQEFSTAAAGRGHINSTAATISAARKHHHHRTRPRSQGMNPCNLCGHTDPICIPAKAQSKVVKQLVDGVDKDLINTLLECAANIPNGYMILQPHQKPCLPRHADNLRALQWQTVIRGAKKALLMDGSFMGLLAGTVAPLLMKALPSIMSSVGAHVQGLMRCRHK